MEKIQWRQNEIEQMKQLYINNQPIKIIARVLNRTPTSVNKALSRFGIRQKRRTILEKATASNKLNDLANCDIYMNLSQQQTAQEKWVTLDFVHAWLRGRNVNVEKVVCALTHKIHFAIGSARLNPSALVMLFNKKRLEEGLTICWVEKISC
ncbi:MAG: hypothetical protein WCG04_05390 [Alphaproteobacteria bacterium]